MNYFLVNIPKTPYSKSNEKVDYLKINPTKTKMMNPNKD